MHTAYLVARVALDGPAPTMETIVMLSKPAMDTAVVGNKVWLDLMREQAPTREQAEAQLLRRARADFALGKLVTRLYVPPALPAGTNLLAQMEAGRRR